MAKRKNRRRQFNLQTSFLLFTILCIAAATIATEGNALVILILLMSLAPTAVLVWIAVDWIRVVWKKMRNNSR